MEPFKKVIWSEGMLLTPHHFQQWDQYNERLVNHRFEQLSPFNWGISDLVIDTDALTNGQVVVTRLKAIMPDGLMVNMPEQDPLPQSRSLEQAFPPSLDHLDVLIGIPVHRHDGANCRLDDSTSSSPFRYTAELLKVPDDNTGDNVREIAVGRKNSQIFFGAEGSPSYVMIKVASITRASRGTFVLQDSYVPPSLYVSASAPLMSMLRGLLEMLYAKRNALVAHQRPAGELGAVDVRNLLLLQTINAFLPILSHASRIGKVHPEWLYLALARLVGELSTVSSEIDPKDIPAYAHTNLSTTFKELEMKIRVAVEGLTAARYVAIPLTSTRENIWTGPVLDEALLRTGEFYLVATGDMPEEQARELIPRRVKLGGGDDLELIVSRALPGVRLTHVARPPSTLPLRPGSHYFRLETRGEFWESVSRSHTIAVSLSSVLRDIKVEVLATQP